VWITVATDDSAVTLTFGDEGPGFPDESRRDFFSGYTTKITQGVCVGLAWLNSLAQPQ